MIRLALAAALACSPLLAAPQVDSPAAGRFVPRSVSVDGRAHRYSVWLPAGYEGRASWPGILFLHGRGECGFDNELQLTVGLPPRLGETPEAWPFVVVVPQKPFEDQQWEELDAVLDAIVTQSEREERVDPRRWHLTGLSQGGHGTLTYGARNPERWRSLAPVCAYLAPARRVEGRLAWGGQPSVKLAALLAPRLAGTPVWLWHGEADSVVPVGESSLMHAQLTELGGEPQLTLLPGVDHDSWNAAYAGSELAAWMQANDPGPHAGHSVVVHGNGKLVRYAPDGSVEWELPWGGIHDIHVLASGNLMVQRGHAAVVEIDVATKSVVWEYDSDTSNGNTPGSVEVHAFQPLANGNVMIAESGSARIIEVDREGKLVHSLQLKVNRPHRHMDTRLARKLAGGTYLVCHEGDGFVREYAHDGAVVWEYDVPLFGREARGGHGPESFGDKTFGALRLANGNTLITTGNGHSVLEVTPWKDIVWSVTQHELPGIRLAWVTTLEVLPNGNYMIGNCHAGPGQPLLIELEPRSKRVVWTLDEYEALGNNVSNSALLGEKTVR